MVFWVLGKDSCNKVICLRNCERSRKFSFCQIGCLLHAWNRARISGRERVGAGFCSRPRRASPLRFHIAQAFGRANVQFFLSSGPPPSTVGYSEWNVGISKRRMEQPWYRPPGKRILILMVNRLEKGSYKGSRRKGLQKLGSIKDRPRSFDSAFLLRLPTYTSP